MLWYAAVGPSCCYMLLHVVTCCYMLLHVATCCYTIVTRWLKDLNLVCLFQYVMVSNDTNLCYRKSGLELQRSDNISFNAVVGNQQQSSGVVYVSLPATVFGLVHEVQLAICPCHRIYYTVQ